MSVLTKRHLTLWRTLNDILWSLKDRHLLVQLKMIRDKELKLPIGKSQLARVVEVIAHAAQFFDQSKMF